VTVEGSEERGRARAARGLTAERVQSRLPTDSSEGEPSREISAPFRFVHVRRILGTGHCDFTKGLGCEQALPAASFT